MSSVQVRPGRLSFKGGEPAAAAKAKGTKRKADKVEEVTDVWVRVESLADFSGPLFVCIAGGAKCVASTEGNEVKLVNTPKTPEGKDEPDAVGQVFVAHQLLPGVVSLKSAHGRYLSSDKFGIVSLAREAVGPQEEWTVVLREDGVAFQSKYDKFLMAEEERGGLRADSEHVGFAETFLVKCQAARRLELRKKQQAKEEKAARDLELETVKKFQAWGGGRVHMTKEDEEELKRARTEGQLNELLLDRRAKMKSDKHCK